MTTAATSGLRFAVIGGGVAGLVAAYVLARRHSVVLYEARERLGGHAHTVDVELDGRAFAVDTGFIVLNDRTYPLFTRLLDQLGVATHEAPMSFGVRSDRSGVEYAVTSLDSLFAQRHNALRPSFYRLLVDIARWNRLAERSRGARYESMPLRELLERHRFSRRFADEYLLPLGSAIWSCPSDRLGEFPVGFLTAFLHNHGMLAWSGHPQWRTVTGGSRRYIEAIAAAWRTEARLGQPVKTIARGGDAVAVETEAGRVDRFDHAVVACHADRALSMLDDPTPVERKLLGCFEYQRNVATLHTDTRSMPRSERAWAAWNYHVRHGDENSVTLTYAMNRLQSLDAPRELLVTINDPGTIDERAVLGRWTYHHPLYSVRTAAAQSRHRELIDANRTSYCGAYWGYGFHEDGVASALRVCEAFGDAL
jgi:predicted NAD/FAD-binding protein